MPKPQLTFMYGYPASGKTTYARKLAEETDSVYLAADEIRRELYGSQDCFGNPTEIYGILLNRMLSCLRHKKSVVYDACNLYKQYRLDYLEHILEERIACRKAVIRMNTTMDTCLANHARRGRDFDIQDVKHYFALREYPDLSEGWDEITDVPDHELEALRFYVTVPFVRDADYAVYRDITERIRAAGHAVTTPLERKFPKNKRYKDIAKYIESAMESADAVLFVSADGAFAYETEIAVKLATGLQKPVYAIDAENARPENFDALKWRIFKELSKTGKD